MTVNLAKMARTLPSEDINGLIGISGAVVYGENGTTIVFSGERVVVVRGPLTASPVPTPLPPEGNNPGTQNRKSVVGTESTSQSGIEQYAVVRNLRPNPPTEAPKAEAPKGVPEPAAKAIASDYATSYTPSIMDEEFEHAAAIIADRIHKAMGLPPAAARAFFDKWFTNVPEQIGRMVKNLKKAKDRLTTRIRNTDLSDGFSDLTEGGRVASNLRYAIDTVNELETALGLPTTPIPQKVRDAEAMRSALRRGDDQNAENTPRPRKLVKKQPLFNKIHG